MKDRGSSDIISRIFPQGGNTPLDGGALADAVRTHAIFGIGDAEADALSPSFNTTRSSILGSFDENPYAGFMRKDFQDSTNEALRNHPDIAKEALNRAFDWEIADSAQSIIVNSTLDSGRAFKSIFRSVDSISNRGLFGRLGSDMDAERQYARDRLVGFGIGFANNSNSSNAVLGWADHALGQIVERDIKQAQGSSYKLRSEVNEASASGVGLTVAKRLLETTDYVARPGIAMAASLIHDAEGEINIDMYQLQNKGIQDLLTTKILMNPDLKVNVRTAFLGDDVRDDVALGILGPNSLVLRTLRELGANNANINIVTGPERSHSKFLLTENAAIIGTQNLTASAGSSIHQSGSNYEAIRVLSNTLEGKSLNEVNAIDSDKLRDMGAGRAANVLLYRQARETMNSVFNAGNQMSSGQENVVKGHEIWQHLKRTVELGHTNTKVRSVFNLDQVFLLQYENDMVAKYEEGEFGKFDEATAKEYGLVDKGRMGEYRDTQLKFLKQVIEGRARVTVDVRNYNENIQEKLFQKVGGILGDAFGKNYGYSISNVVDSYTKGITGTDARISALSRGLQGNGVDANAAKSLAVQMLVSASGNVELSTTSRQHLKEYAAYTIGSDGKPRFLSQMMGSSNLGALSMAITSEPIENKIASVETGLAFYNDNMKGVTSIPDPLKGKRDDKHKLDQRQTLDQLQKAGAFTLHNASELSGGSISVGLDTAVDRRASWEKNVDRQRLVKLHDSLKTLGKEVGLGEDFFGVKKVFDNRGNFISLELAIDSGSIAGIAGSRKLYKFTTLTNASGEDRDGFIFAINENKLIGESLFANRSNTDINDPFSNGVIAAGGRKRLSAQETLISMLSGISMDIARAYLVDSPYEEYNNRYKDPTALKGGIVQYLLDASGNSKGTVESLLGADNESLLIMGKNIVNKLLFAGDSQMMPLSESQKAERRSIIELQVTELFSNFAKGDRDERVSILFGGESMKPKSSSKEHKKIAAEHNKALTSGADMGIRTFSDLFTYMIEREDPIFSDFVVDFVGRQRDRSYFSNVKKGLSERFTSMFEVFLTSGQARTYGSTQAQNKLPLFGVDDSREDWIEAMASQDSPMKKLFAFALTSSPLEYHPGVTLGEGEGLYIRGVAEGGSSREERASRNYLTSMFDGKLSKSYKHGKVGDVTDIKIIEDTGTGFIVSAQRREAYLTYLESMGIDGSKLAEVKKRMSEEAGKFEGDIYLFNFSDPRKLHQIPQRLKNVIGMRPLYDLSVEYQELIETGTTTRRGLFDGTMKTITSSSELRDVYLEDLRQGLRTELASKKFNSVEIDAYVNKIDASVEIGVFYPGKLKNFISEAMLNELDRMAIQIEQEYGVMADTAIGQQLLRARVINAEFNGSGYKGFIGSSQRSGRPDVMLLQMAGAYSDPWFANPNFGSKGGIRQAYPDRAVKSNKASMFSANLKINEWDTAIEGMGLSVKQALAIGEGDVIRFDPETNKSWVMSRDGDGQLIKKIAVDDKSQFTLMKGIIESLNGNNPSLAKLELKSFINTAVGEYGIEVIRGLKILSGSPNTNEIEIEVLFDRSRLPGGGSRFASHSGLFKGVSIFAYGTFFQDIVKHMTRDMGAVSNFLFGGADGDLLKVDQIIGLASPSNIKSYFFQHGATVLTHENGRIAREMLQTVDVKTLAFGLLTSFGDEMYGFNESERDGLRRRIGEGALKGEFGEFYKNAAARELFGSTGVTSKDALYTMVGEALISQNKNDAVRDIQFNVLRSIDSRDLLDIFHSNQRQKAENNIRNQLSAIFGNESSDFINTADGQWRIKNSLSGREASIIAGALHIVVQQKMSKVINLPTFDVTDQDAILSMGMMMGMTRKQLTDETDKEFMQSIVTATAARFSPIGIFMEGAYSQSQIPLSSRKGASLEAQHIIPASFAMQSKSFNKGGSVDALRTLMANYYGVISKTSPAALMSTTAGMEVIDLTSLRGVGTQLKSQMLGVYAGYQGDTMFKEYRNKYEAYNLGYTLSSIQLTGIPADELKTNLLGVFGGIKGFEDITLQQMLKDPNTDLPRIQAYMKTRLNEVINHFHIVEKKFALDPDKSLSIDFAEGITRGMKATGSKTFGYSIPKMEFMPQTGQIRIYQEKVYGVSLGGSDLSALGEQFGDFLSEEQKAMVKIWRGLAPGSDVSRVLSKIHNMSAGDTIIDGLTMEEIRAMEEFTDVTIESTDMINRAAVGRRTQQVFGNKIGVEGGVYTGASSWLVPKGINITPKEILSRASLRVATERTNKFSFINAQLAHSARILDQSSEAVTRLKILKDMGPLGNVVRGDYFEALNRNKAARRASRFYTTQEALITDGVSQTGEAVYRELVTDANSIRSQLNKLGADNLLELRKLLDTVLEKSNSYKKQATRGDVRGDSFITEIGIGQMAILKADIMQKMNAHEHVLERALRDKQFYSEVRMPWDVEADGLDIGRDSRYRDDQERSNYVSQSLDTFRGRIREEHHHDAALSSEKRLMGTTKREQQEAFLTSIGVSDAESLTSQILIQAVDNVLEVAREFNSKIVEGNEDIFARRDRDGNRVAGGDPVFSGRLVALERRLGALRNTVLQLQSEAAAGRDTKERLGDARHTLDALSSEFIVEFHGASNFAGRSAPPGNLQLLFSTFRNTNLKTLDYRLQELGVNIRFTPGEDEWNRNKTLGLQRPIGMLVSMLGDYDGDSIIAMLDHSIKSRLQLKTNTTTMNDLATQINTVELDLVNLKAQPQSLYDPDLIKLIAEKENFIVKQKSRMTGLEISQNDLSLVVQAVDNSFSRIGFDQAARTWVAAYTKVDERFFVATNKKDSRGREGWASETISPDVLFSYIEQGKGLFPGLEDMYKGADVMYQDVRSISQEMAKIAGPNRSAYTKDQLNQALGNLHNTGGNRMATIFQSINEVREGHEEELLQAIKDTDEARYVADMSNAAAQNKEVGKLINKAFGSGIDASRFEMLSQVLGEAGSVLLGKSYNNLIGTLYSDAPLLSSANAILQIQKNSGNRKLLLTGIARHRYEEDYRQANQGASEADIAAHMDTISGDDAWRAAGSAGRAEVRGIGRSVFESARDIAFESQQLGGFLQTINQIMRDSIKLKGGENFLESLGERLAEYRAADTDEAKSKIIKEIAGQLGDGAGMKALQQLESFNSNFSTLYDKSTKAKDRGEILANDFKLSTQDRDSLAPMLGFKPVGIQDEELKTMGYRKYQEGMDKDTSYEDISYAAYKTKRDLVSQVSSFAFQKNISNGGNDLASAIESGLAARSGYEHQAEYDQLMGFTSEIHNRLNEVVTKGRSIHEVRGEINTWAKQQGRHAIDIASSILDIDGEVGIGVKGSSGITLDDSRKALYVTTYMDARSQIEGFAGEYGEGLIKIAQFNAMRASTASGKLQNVIRTTWAGEKDGMTMAVITAAVTGKIDEGTMASMAVTLTDAYKGLRQGTGDKSATEGEMYLSVMRDMVSGQGANGFNHNEAHTNFLHVMTALGTTQAGKSTIDNVSKSIRNTFFGQVAQTVGAHIKSTMPIKDSTDPVTGYLMDTLGLNKQMAESYATLINANDPNATGMTTEKIIENAMRANHHANTVINKPSAISKDVSFGNSKAAAVLLNKNTEHYTQLALLPLLGILGQAVSTGSVDPEIAQQVLGNSISMVAYMKPPSGHTNMTRLGGAIVGATGSGFKGRFALQEHEGDVAKAFTSLAIRESSMMVFGMLATPIVTKGVNRLFGYKGPSIDFDKFQGTRGIASTIVGAITTAMLGMAVGEGVSSFVVPPPTNGGVLAAALKAAFDIDLSTRADLGDEPRNDVKDEFGDNIEYQTTTLTVDNQYLDRVVQGDMGRGGQDPSNLEDQYAVGVT